MRQQLRKLVRKLGYDLIRYPPPSHPQVRRVRVLQRYGIDTVLDVGANSGQYGHRLREFGYQGRILSFEPLSTAFQELKARAAGDAAWEVYPFALGDREEERRLNVARNSCSSSLLAMLPPHLEAAPESAYLGQERVAVKTLDQVVREVCHSNDRIFLKIDTQGYEKPVLDGGRTALARIDTLELELSLVQLYAEQWLLGDLLQLLSELGYGVLDLVPGFADRKSGQLLQVDATFHRF